MLALQKSANTLPALYVGDIQLVAAGLHRAKDKVKPLVRIILIQAYLEIRRLIVIGEIHCAPFDVLKMRLGALPDTGSKDATAAGEG